MKIEKLKKILKKDYGWDWDGFDILTDIQKELVMDVISATEKEMRKEHEKLLQGQLDDIAVKLRFLRANTPISKGLADGREIRNKLKDLIDEIENG